jgi:hypothetical protein
MHLGGDDHGKMMGDLRGVCSLKKGLDEILRVWTYLMG